MNEWWLTNEENKGNWPNKQKQETQKNRNTRDSTPPSVPKRTVPPGRGGGAPCRPVQDRDTGEASRGDQEPREAMRDQGTREAMVDGRMGQHSHGHVTPQKQLLGDVRNSEGRSGGAGTGGHSGGADTGGRSEGVGTWGRSGGAGTWGRSGGAGTWGRLAVATTEDDATFNHLFWLEGGKCPLLDSTVEVRALQGG